MTQRVRIEEPHQVIADYVAGISENQLAKRCGVSRTALKRFLERHNVPRRDVAHANRLMMAERSPEENARNSAAAHEAARHHVHTEKEKIARALTRERKQLHVSPSELYLAEVLTGRGWFCTPQKAIGIYNVDLEVDDVAIEVYGGGWHTTGRHAARSEERFKYLLERMNVIVIWVDRRYYPLSSRAVDSIEAFLKADKGHGEFLVLRGDGTTFHRGKWDLHVLAIKPPRA